MFRSPICSLPTRWRIRYLSRMWREHEFCTEQPEAVPQPRRRVIDIKGRIQKVKEKVKSLRRASHELQEHSAMLRRHSARLRAFTPLPTEHLVKLRLNNRVTLAGTFSQRDGITDGDVSTPVAD